MSKTAIEAICDSLAGADYYSECSADDAKELVTDLDAAGFVIVPKEPTQAMIDAGAAVDAWVYQEGQAPQPEIYRAMIAAASSNEKTER